MCNLPAVKDVLVNDVVPLRIKSSVGMRSRSESNLSSDSKSETKMIAYQDRNHIE